MQRKWKIVLGVSITILVLTSGFITLIVLNNNKDDNGPLIEDPPVLLFPVENINVLEMLYGYSWDNVSSTGHNGIDFIINDTATIIASCNMTCNGKSLFYNEIGDNWQAGCSFDINDAFELFYAFESFADNEIDGNIQLDNILVEAGQEVVAGEIIGYLLLHNPSAHIHYMLQRYFEPVCPYLYFSNESKIIFDTLWVQIGWGTDPCNCTTYVL